MPSHTGLPPTRDEVDAFLNDDSADAYEKVVDRLLTSPHFGEHIGRYWLDAARYGDTHGLHLDNYREFWLYRDWVINAFNDNKSFKDFTIEQLAGDLLENPTTEQLIASGFNRAHVTTSEGGSIAEEVYVRNVVDRVSTTSTVFMGLTAGCAVCHDHKYDPITQREFYSLFAFFNSLDANPLDGNRQDHAPVIFAPSKEQALQIEDLQREMQLARAQIAAALSKYEYKDPGAEMLRDQALAVSGWLQDTVGGPSVKPPQPDGLSFAVGYSGSNTVRFTKDAGHEKVHRRSLYTFWKRIAPPPQMNAFDAPSRESCTVRRERTNTPLQALMLLNDPQYVEAARRNSQRPAFDDNDFGAKAISYRSVEIHVHQIRQRR